MGAPRLELSPFDSTGPRRQVIVIDTDATVDESPALSVTISVTVYVPAARNGCDVFGVGVVTTALPSPKFQA